MHRWDRRLRLPPAGVAPIPWREAEGDPSRGQLRGPSWRRTSHGHYVPQRLEVSSSQRIVEAVPLIGTDGALTGWASAFWRGVPLLGGNQVPLPVALGAAGSLRARHGVVASRERLPADEVDEVRGIRCVLPLRARFDSARTRLGLRQGVVEVDMMLAAGLLTAVDLAAYVADHVGWRRVPQARQVLELVDSRTASPPETQMRLAWMLDAGLPRPLVNRPVFDLTGRLLGYPDALEPDSGTILEYDSDDHRELAYHTGDNIREEVFEDHNAVVMRVTRLDLRRPRSSLVARMRRAYGRGLARDRGRDRWTLTAPPDWRDHWC